MYGTGTGDISLLLFCILIVSLIVVRKSIYAYLYENYDWNSRTYAVTGIIGGLIGAILSGWLIWGYFNILGAR
jgi:hypothetical protein